MKEAKRKLEDRQRKERRENQMEMVRKPLLATPNQKRSRKEDGEWDSDQQKQTVILVTTAQKQTPLSGFLVQQTLEERRHAITRRQPICSGSTAKDMSASPARRRTVSMKKKGAKNAKKAVEDITIAKMTPGNVNNIRKFFEKPGLTTHKSACVVQPGNTDNNNGVCVATANQTLAAVGTEADPEMALQVGVCVATASQPTGSEIGTTSGHITSAEPIRDEAPVPDQNREGGSHVGQQQQKPMDSQGCSAD